MSTLSTNAEDRKARLAQLKSLKRKAPDSETSEAKRKATEPERAFDNRRRDPGAAKNDEEGKQPRRRGSPSVAPARPRKSQHLQTWQSVTKRYLSGRNYDTTTKAARLGFDEAPLGANGTETLEEKAAAVELEERAQREADEADAEKPLDLFKLQPKRPNWDLKREYAKRTAHLAIKTDNAIARIVREQVRAKQQAAAERRKKKGGTAEDEGPEEVGMDGAALVEATRELEREDRANERRQTLEDEDEDDAFL